MDKPIIEIKNIAKKYTITHQQGGYIALRDILANILKNPFKILTTLEVLGFYSPYSNGKVKEWTFPSVLNRFSYINNIAELRNLNGACICFNPSNNIAMELLENWEYLSTDINFIAPIGSSRLNHRQDQSLLTLLAHKYNLAKNMPHGYLDFSIHNDID